ncbi:MAG TPA: hypothetical protein VIS48_01320 [Candidatus Kryptonia bacterium]
MIETESADDAYVGTKLNETYTIAKFINRGGIGKIYLAEGLTQNDRLACKVIAEGDLRYGWERELEKVILLRGVPNVVPYHAHGSNFDKNNRPFYWILWDYIPGLNLREYLAAPSWPLDLAFVEEILKTILKVLHACKAVRISHGDLHEGNILIRDPDQRIPNSPKTIWISDFGYGGSHNKVVPKDDFRQLFSITASLMGRLEQADLDARDKLMLQKLYGFINKRLLEVDATQGAYEGNVELLLNELEALAIDADRESAAASKKEDIKTPGDYLFAEALGYRVEEWKDLFVPEFPAAEDLLSRNNVVLTGARGCGKTMSFRRLTVFMDKVIGEPSKVEGSDQFVGFYLNCREFVEAFPWLPKKIGPAIEQQLIQYFHLAWLSEVTKTMGQFGIEQIEKYDWLNLFMSRSFGNRYATLPENANVLNHVRAFIENEKERCRITKFGKYQGIQNWPLARLDFLDLLQAQLEANARWVGEKPMYMFLDDYTIPTVVKDVQKALNPIIFKRRSKLFFKVSTESSNSFSREGLQGKPLELHQDFELIDLATESIHQDPQSKAKFLERIFKPRIDRHPSLKGKSLGLRNVLGKMSISNNELAFLMREATQRGKKKTIHYHGFEAFIGMWSSDVRIMIQMLVDILREANGNLREGKTKVDSEIQDRVFRSAGGELLTFIESVRDPTLWEKGPSSTKIGEPFGVQLKNIVEAFVNVSRYEMTQGPLVSNQGRMNPKQAFRLEIIDKFDLNSASIPFYEGLVRWHVFLQDWRGKSVRGMMTPRLYLNRVLIPFSKLTFSSHDHIHLNNQQFQQLLVNPNEFFDAWKRHKKRKGSHGKAHSGKDMKKRSPQLEIAGLQLSKKKRK